MRVLILGGDGYLGWPTALHLAARGHQVMAVDCHLRRELAARTSSEPLLAAPDLPERCRLAWELLGLSIEPLIADLREQAALDGALARWRPEAVVHFAEQPSAPYSMMGMEEARLTLRNNLNVTFNLIWAVARAAPDCHIIKLGTMGEYGTPDIDIEEGWLDVEHRGRRHRFLYPRQAGSLYHTTKIMDTDLLWFYVRNRGLAVTDLMQGPVYGLITEQTAADERLLPFLNYDGIFGTVLNRFVVQAVAGVPLTVYGRGGQRRGYLDLRDTLQCLQLAVENPARPGQLRILNQFTETFTVNQLADKVVRAAEVLDMLASVQHIPNPRQEEEEHYYNPAHSGLLELGLKPHPLTEDTITGMLELVARHRDAIDEGKILPRVKW